ncbi:MAG TPA: helix-hairpin-helix domain-containing protein [Ginsengibacter sp.]|nr:helix-hairpin-helix domain-containing protein [Ginsengibacter sp.]
MWKQFLNNYFIFTRKERRAIILIVILILLFALLPLVYPLVIPHASYNYSEFKEEIARLSVAKNDSAKEKMYAKNFDNEFNDDRSLNEEKKYGTIKAETFYFDPNTASADDWKKLGVREKTIHTIYNYLSKGGRFYKPEDIKKIWGLSPTDAQRLIPYVSIKNNNKKYTFEKTEYPANKSFTAKSVLPIDINIADTTALISLPGIGSKLAQRIIAFRNKLGGFYSVDQVAETYLLPDSTFQKIKPRLIAGRTPVKQININTASVDDMKSQSYLRYNLANAIYQYRQQHGDFKSVEEIKKIMLVTDEIFNKVQPYLTVQ